MTWSGPSAFIAFIHRSDIFLTNLWFLIWNLSLTYYGIRFTGYVGGWALALFLFWSNLLTHTLGWFIQSDCCHNRLVSKVFVSKKRSKSSRDQYDYESGAYPFNTAGANVLMSAARTPVYRIASMYFMYWWISLFYTYHFDMPISITCGLVTLFQALPANNLV